MVPQAANLCGELFHTLSWWGKWRKRKPEEPSLWCLRDSKTQRPVLDTDSVPVSCLQTVLVFPLAWLKYPSAEALPPCVEVWKELHLQAIPACAPFSVSLASFHSCFCHLPARITLNVWLGPAVGLLFLVLPTSLSSDLWEPFPWGL